MPASLGIFLWLVFGIAALLLVVAWIYGDEARIARRFVLRFFLTIALPVVAMLGVPLFLVAVFLDLDPRLWQALIAGLVISTGWLTAAIFTEQGKTRLKAERLRDYHKAIYAEIGTSVSALWDEGNSDTYVETILNRMEAEPDFVPFIPREKHDHIYDAIVQEIDVLPRLTIDPIVAYYSQIKSISALADDMRDVRYQDLAPDRRVLVYRDYADMRNQAFAYGQYALRLITAFSDGGSAAAEDVRRQFSIPGGDRNGPSQGSE